MDLPRTSVPKPQTSTEPFADQNNNFSNEPPAKFAAWKCRLQQEVKPYSRKERFIALIRKFPLVDRFITYLEVRKVLKAIKNKLTGATWKPAPDDDSFPGPYGKLTNTPSPPSTKEEWQALLSDLPPLKHINPHNVWDKVAKKHNISPTLKDQVHHLLTQEDRLNEFYTTVKEASDWISYDGFSDLEIYDLTRQLIEKVQHLHRQGKYGHCKKIDDIFIGPDGNLDLRLQNQLDTTSPIAKTDEEKEAERKLEAEYPIVTTPFPKNIDESTLSANEKNKLNDYRSIASFMYGLMTQNLPKDMNNQWAQDRLGNIENDENLDKPTQQALMSMFNDDGDHFEKILEFLHKKQTEVAS